MSGRPDPAADERYLTQLKALANVDRLRLLRLLGQPERFPDNLVDPLVIGVCVNDLAAASGLPQSTASHHLGILEKAGLLVTTRHGQWKYARPASDELAALARAVEQLGAAG